MHQRKRLTGLAAISAAAALALAACAPGGDGGDSASGGLEDCDENPNTCNSGERAEGGDINWVISSKPGSWFGASPEGGSVYLTQALHGILPHTGQWAPDGENYEYNMDLLAEEPELVSEDPHTSVFKIRPEAEWDDGTPITAEDFRITWMMVSGKEEHCEGCRPRSTSHYEIIDSIEGSDDGKTVTVTLEEGESYPEWFGLFSALSIAGGIYPAHVAEENGFDVDKPKQLGEYFEWLNENMPEFSGGPYKIVEGDLENQVIKEPNENWYGETEPTLDTLVTRFIDDEDAWIPALTNGEIHGAAPAQMNADVFEQAENAANASTSIAPGPAWEHIDLNLENEWLEDVELRRAIFTAIDVEDIAERNFGSVFPDYEIKTNHVFPNNSPHHEDVLSGTGQGSGDAEAALQILEDAGYEYDGSELTLDGEQVGPFRLRATTAATRTTAMELIQSHLSEIGVEVNIETTDDLGGTLGEQDYDIMQFGWSTSPFFVNSPMQFWHSESGSNFGGYSNEKVDELAEKTASASTQEEAAEYANEAARIVTEDAYVLPIMHEPNYMMVTDDYVNVRDNLSSYARALYNNQEWGTAAE